MESNPRLRRFLMFLRTFFSATKPYTFGDSSKESALLLASERRKINQSYGASQGCIVVAAARNTLIKGESDALLAYSELLQSGYSAIRVGKENSTICFLDNLGNAFTLETLSRLERTLPSSILSHGLIINEAPPICPTSAGSTKK